MSYDTPILVCDLLSASDRTALLASVQLFKCLTIQQHLPLCSCRYLTIQLHESLVSSRRVLTVDGRRITSQDNEHPITDNLLTWKLNYTNGEWRDSGNTKSNAGRSAVPANGGPSPVLVVPVNNRWWSSEQEWQSAAKHPWRHTSLGWIEPLPIAWLRPDVVCMPLANRLSPG